MEAAAIVGSILLAFAIDAWWEGESERALEQRLLLGLLDDFEASQEMADFYLQGYRRVQGGLQDFVGEIRSAPTGSSITLRNDWIAAAIGGPTYSPVEATLHAAIASGDIGLIRDANLRHALVQWRQVLADTSEDELLIRQIVLQQVMPALGADVRLAAYLDNAKMVAFFGGGDPDWDAQPQSIQNTPALEAAIAHRLFYNGFAVSGMEEIERLQGELLRMIRANLDDTAP